MNTMKRSNWAEVVFTTFIGIYSIVANASPRHPNVESLTKNSREIFQVSMEWADRYFDPKAKLCKAPSFPATPEHRSAPVYMVRESSWYALGLLLRDGQGDRERAAQILEEILKAQYHEPGKPWNGTFRRTPAEPYPGPHAAMWSDYDPNWREFIGTTFVIILKEYPDRLPVDLDKKMIWAVDDAVAGEMQQHRLLPTYTNPALMYGFLLEFASDQGNMPTWKKEADRWMDLQYNIYKQYQAFPEYNSPTYAGTDLFALALWRNYGATEQTRSRGMEMEAGLWRETANLYNANLRNISGPYDRSYGMDMRSYISVTGLWLRTVLDEDRAPLAKIEPPVDHVADLWFASPIVVLDTAIPADALEKFEKLKSEHEITRQIDKNRIATAWIGNTMIYGAEAANGTRDVDSHSQYHPVTVQWLVPDGQIGWIQLIRAPRIDATANREGIVIKATGDIVMRIYAPETTPDRVRGGKWGLPGLNVILDTDAKKCSVLKNDKYIDVRYEGLTRMAMRLSEVNQQ